MTPATRTARLGLGFAVTGLVLGLLGPLLESAGSNWDGVPSRAPWLVAVGVILQAASLAFLVAGVITGIVALVRRVRPVAPAVLAIVAVPVTGVLVVIEVFILFLLTP
jgi:hypothetical protein